MCCEVEEKLFGSFSGLYLDPQGLKHPLNEDRRTSGFRKVWHFLDLIPQTDILEIPNGDHRSLFLLNRQFYYTPTDATYFQRPVL